MSEEMQAGYAKYRQALFKCGRRCDRNGSIIMMPLTFDEWWSIWEESGHWAERGTRLGQYFMKRRDFLGSYEVGTVSIEQHKPRITKIGRGRPGFKVMGTCPHCAKVGNLPALKRWHFDNCVNL